MTDRHGAARLSSLAWADDGGALRVPSRLGGLAFDDHFSRRCSRARRAQAAPWNNLLGVVRWALRRAGDGVGGVARGARGSAVELIVPSAKPPSRAPASRARKVLQGPLQARSALRRRAPSLFPPETPRARLRRGTRGVAATSLLPQTFRPQRKLRSTCSRHSINIQSTLVDFSQL